MPMPSLDELLYAYYLQNIPQATIDMYSKGGKLPVGTGNPGGGGTPPTPTWPTPKPNIITDNSSTFSGTVAAPTANSVIAETTSLTGTFKIQIQVMVSGATAQSDMSNMVIKNDTAMVFPMLYNVKDVPVNSLEFYAKLAAKKISVLNVNAATAATNYYANIVATRIDVP